MSGLQSRFQHIHNEPEFVTRLAGEQSALPAATVWQWLEAVQASWRNLIALGLGPRWKHEFEKEVAKIKGSML
jgi:hypothetical protein